jgi:uncharacterized protein YlbG (UPF0298 family)
MHVTRIEQRNERYSLGFYVEGSIRYSFPCTRFGKVRFVSAAARATYIYVLKEVAEQRMSAVMHDESSSWIEYHGTCDCGASLVGYVGEEFSCEKCEREYNLSGCPLRSNWRSNASLRDSEITDTEGYEIGELAHERF